MNTLSLATATFAQTPSFWHAGTELLRSKSLDRNSYNSGDWFNRIDWTGQESTFGSGLPRAADNGEKWGIMAPLLANPALKPGASDIAAAEASALDLLRVRSEVDLLRLGSAELIQQKVTFPGSGPDAAPGVIAMLVDDLVGADVDPALDGALVVFNASHRTRHADDRRASRDAASRSRRRRRTAPTRSSRRRRGMPHPAPSRCPRVPSPSSSIASRCRRASWRRRRSSSRASGRRSR